MIWFSNLDLIYKVTKSQRMLKNAFLSVPYLMKGWMDYNQTCIDISKANAKELIKFQWPCLHFEFKKGQRMSDKNCQKTMEHALWELDFKMGNLVKHHWTIK